jgi:hypothetical protein
VRPLPAAGKPADFSGLVGQYTLSSRVDKTSVEANQPITLTLIVAGDGNVSTAPEPAMALPQGVRAYDAQSHVETTKENYRLRGEKVIEKILIPQTPGPLAIPPAQLSVFDPRSGGYKALRTDTLRVAVLPSSSPVLATDGERTVRRIGRDLREIREGERVLARPKRWMYEQPLFWVGQALPLGAFLVATRMGRARRRFDQDEGLARAQRARGYAVKRLRDARRALQSNDADAFFATLGHLMAEYVSDKLGHSRRAVSREELLASLRSAGAEDPTVERLQDLLERCDMGRFAPGGADAAGRAGLLAAGEDLIVELEKLFRASRAA